PRWRCWCLGSWGGFLCELCGSLQLLDDGGQIGLLNLYAIFVLHDPHFGMVACCGSVVPEDERPNESGIACLADGCVDHRGNDLIRDEFSCRAHSATPLALECVELCNTGNFKIGGEP